MLSDGQFSSAETLEEINSDLRAGNCKDNNDEAAMTLVNHFQQDGVSTDPWILFLED